MKSVIGKIRKRITITNNMVHDRCGWDLLELMLLAGCMLSLFLMTARAFFGTEFTDEAFTVSDALTIMHGNIPYTYNTVIVAGQAFIPIIFYKIYELVCPDFEGIFLFSRLSYMAFRFFIIFAIYHLLCDKVNRKCRLLIVGILITFGGSGSIQNWGYNATSTYLILLIVFLLYNVLDNDKVSDRRCSVTLFFCGFLSALSVFAHQGCAVAVLLFMVLIYLNGSNQRLFKVFIYCLGGITEIILVMVPIIVQSGWKKFAYGVGSILLGAPDNYIKNTVMDRAGAVFHYICLWWIMMLLIAIIMFVIGIYYIRVDEKKLSKKEYWLMAVSISLLVCIIYSMKQFGAVAFFTNAGVIIIGAFILMTPIHDRWSSLFWYLGLYNILFIILLTITSLTGERFYYCIPVIIPLLIELFNSRKHLLVYIGYVIAVVFILFMGYTSYKQVYRDDSLINLSTKVESGVYKGIYTTADRAKDVVELEEYLNANIKESESVSFRDNVPIAYLMRNKNICDVRTWDVMQWTYECNDPTLMYRYYKNKGSIPDVIVYIDFGRDESLSIENPSEVFQYNDFVNKYYYLDKDDFENNTFRVLIYRNNNTFDGNFDMLLDSIK